MSRLAPFIIALLAACQANVNLTGASATDTESTGGDTNNTTNNSSGESGPNTTGNCPDGTDGCPCYGNGTCNDDLVCNPKNLCEPPAPNTTGNTTDNTSGNASDSTTGSTTDSTTGSTTDTTTGNTSNTTTGNTSGNTTDETMGNTTGNADPGCDGVPADMVCVPADTFEMGTDLLTFLGAEVSPQEKPAHTVTLTKTYWIDRNEVTVEDYAMCWALKVCELPMQGQMQGYNWGVAGKEKHPINGVNWYQAKTYCEWKGKRLPTEAEWELAARGTDGRLFPWGNDKPTCELTVSDSCGTVGTQAVGSKPLGASPYGALDMAGNVVEWCADYFTDDYYYQSPEVDPQGPLDGTKRAGRSFNPPLYGIDQAIHGRATLRGGYSPLLQDVNPTVMGIRCAQTP